MAEGYFGERTIDNHSEEPAPLRGEVDEPDPSPDRRSGDGSEVAAVGRVRGVVTLDPVPVLAKRRAIGRDIARFAAYAFDHLEARVLRMHDDHDVADAHAVPSRRDRPVPGLERRRHARPLHLDAERAEPQEGGEDRKSHV